MHLHYESGTLQVENARGLRWHLTDAAKPPFTFGYDAVSVTDERAVRRIGPALEPLALDQIQEVRAFVTALAPPAWASFQRQTIGDLRAFARGLIGSVVAQLEYEGLLDVMISARQGSADLYSEEARRVLEYVDSVWNAFHALAAQIQNTPADEVKSVKEYAQLMPSPPPPAQFGEGVLQEMMYGASGRG